MIKSLRRIGNSIGCTFPKSLLDRLKLKEGDQVEFRDVGGKMEIIPKRKIVPMKLGGIWKDAKIDMDLEEFKRLRKEAWKGVGS